MQVGARFQAIIDFFDEWLVAVHAPSACYSVTAFDVALAKFTKARRYMGKKDRVFITEHAYDILRQYKALTKALEHAGIEAHMHHVMWLYIIVCCTELKGAETAEIAENIEQLTKPPYGLPAPNPNIIAQKQTLNTFMQQHDIANISDDLVQYFTHHNHMSYKDDIWPILQQKRQLHIRVNGHKATRAQVLVTLQKQGIEAYKLTGCDYGLALPHYVLKDSEYWMDGVIDIQARESQIACDMVPITNNMVIIDYCAGAGGKALYLGAKAANNAFIYMHDIRPHMVKEAFKRARRQHIKLQHLAHKKNIMADCVMVDAPCSGSGNWHKNPEQALFFDKNCLNYYHNQQLAILKEACQYVKKGGILLYMTCSIFDEENAQTLKAFVTEHTNFTIETTKAFHPKYGDDNGFFVAKLKHS